MKTTTMKTGKTSTILATAALLAAFLLPAAARVGDRRTAKAPVQDTISRNDSRRFDYFFIEAIRQQNAGHYTAAFDLLNHCLEINPQAAEAYYMRAMYLSELDNDSMALADIERAAALSPGNDTYQERVAQYYIGTKNYDKAIKAYEQLHEHHRDRGDVLKVLAQLYRQKKDYAQMLGAIERLEQTEGPSDDITLAKMNVYELKGDKRNARAMLQSLVDIHPNDAMYKVMLGNWLLQNGEKEKARQMLVAALDNDPDNESAQSSMYDFYRSAGQDSLAAQLRERILTSKKTSVSAKLGMLQSLIKGSESSGGDSTMVLSMFDRALASDNSDDIALMKAAYMSLKKMPEDSVNKALTHVLDIAPDNTTARMQLIQSLWPKQKWDEIIDLCKPAVLYNPEEMAFYYFMGLAYYQKEDDDMALDAFKRGVGEIDDDSDPDIVSDFYAIMGDILYKKGKQQEAFAAYDSCLVWKEDNVSALNNYAYYLSELGIELRRAEQMSYKTVKQEPNNSTFLDTYAWILFKQERYDEARVYIDQALAVDTDSVQSSVVVEHAGDIHAACGDMDGAVDYWNQAIKAGGDKAALSKKIRQRKFVRKDKKQ